MMTPNENFIRSPEDFLWNFYKQMNEYSEGPQEFLSAKGFEKDQMPPDYGAQMYAVELEMMVDYLAGLK